MGSGLNFTGRATEALQQELKVQFPVETRPVAETPPPPDPNLGRIDPDSDWWLVDAGNNPQEVKAAVIQELLNSTYRDAIVMPKGGTEWVRASTVGFLIPLPPIAPQTGDPGALSAGTSLGDTNDPNEAKLETYPDDELKKYCLARNIYQDIAQYDRRDAIQKLAKLGIPELGIG